MKKKIYPFYLIVMGILRHCGKYKKESIANGLALLITMLLTSVIGLSGIFTLLGILILILGTSSTFMKRVK